jgi:hypothetical protein
MTSSDENQPAQPDQAEKSPQEKLAELVAQRKSAGARPHGPGGLGAKASERAAAARSASKSKPAPRKG